MNKLITWLLVGVCLVHLLGCQSTHEQPTVRYCSSFPLDTVVSLHEIPLEGTESSHQIVRMDDKVLSYADYGVVGIYRYPEMSFLYRRSFEHDMFFLEDDHYCGVTNGIAEVFAWKGDSLEQLSSSVLQKGLPRIAIESLGNGDYIYADNYMCQGLNEFHLLNSPSQQQVSKGKYPEPPGRFKHLEEFKVAYSHGIRVKPDKSRFVLYYSLNRRFRIYNRDGEMLHEVFLDYPPANNKVVDTSYDRQYIHFSDAYTTDKYIYLLSPDTRGLGITKPECSILVMDWDSNLVARYRLSAFLYSFFIDEASNTCMGVGCQKGGAYSFFSFNLQD